MQSLRADLAAASRERARERDLRRRRPTTRAVRSREQVHRADAAVSEFRAQDPQRPALARRARRRARGIRRRRPRDASSTDIAARPHPHAARLSRSRPGERRQAGQISSSSGTGSPERDDEDRPVLTVRQARRDRAGEELADRLAEAALAGAHDDAVARRPASARCLIARAGSPTSCRTLQSTPWPSRIAAACGLARSRARLRRPRC